MGFDGFEFDNAGNSTARRAGLVSGLAGRVSVRGDMVRPWRETNARGDRLPSVAGCGLKCIVSRLVTEWVSRAGTTRHQYAYSCLSRFASMDGPFTRDARHLEKNGIPA